MFSSIALSLAGRSSLFLLAATEPPKGMVSVGFIILLVAIAAVSLVVEYLYARFGDSMAINRRFAVTAAVILLMHVFWHSWSQQTNIVAESLLPDASGFRLTIWLFLAISIVFPAWLIFSACKYTWFDRFVSGGLPLVLVRALLCLMLAVSLVWLGSDCATLLAGARLMP